MERGHVLVQAEGDHPRDDDVDGQATLRVGDMEMPFRTGSLELLG